METPKLKPVPADEAIGVSAPEVDDREPTKEEIMEDIRQGLRDVMAGFQGQDALESLEELRRESYGDSDKR